MTVPAPPLRIALVVGTLEVGGTERQLCRLARELKSAGHSVTVILLAAGGPLSATLHRDGIPHAVAGFHGFRFGRRSLRRPDRIVRAELGALRGLWRFGWGVRRARPDICHAFLYGAYVYAIPISALLRVPVRITARRGHVELSRGGRLLQGLSNLYANGLTSNSSAEAVTATHELFMVRPQFVIPNGVDLPAEAARPEVEPPRGVVVANLRPEKGHLLLLEALRRLPSPPSIELVGEGPERGRIEAAIAANGLAGSCVLAGAVADPAPYYRRAQFAVLPSLVEGLPNAVLEAMAAGLPVVASDVGGVRELIRDGDNGVVVPPGDPAALALAIGRLASDGGLRARLGAAARESAAAFSWTACRDAHLELYAELLRRQRARRRRNRR